MTDRQAARMIRGDSVGIIPALAAKVVHAVAAQHAATTPPPSPPPVVVVPQEGPHVGTVLGVALGALIVGGGLGYLIARRD